MSDLPEQAERTTAWKVKSGCRSINPRDSANDPEFISFLFVFDGFQMITLRDERPGGEDTGEDIDAKHHFHRAHFVLENFRLPVRSERIENHVSHQAKKAGKGRCRSITRVLIDSDIS